MSSDLRKVGPIELQRFYAAAVQGHAEIVRLLIRYDANPALLSSNGTSPLEIAVYHGRAKVVDVLLQEVDPRQSRHQLLYDAARRGHERVVYSLLTDGREDVNLRDKTTGVTPMWAAAEKRARSSGRMALNLGGC
jgi:ankyrin repeat protein